MGQRHANWIALEIKSVTAPLNTAVWSLPDAGVCWGQTHAANGTGNSEGILMTSQEVAWAQTMKNKINKKAIKNSYSIFIYLL